MLLFLGGDDDDDDDDENKNCHKHFQMKNLGKKNSRILHLCDHLGVRDWINAYN